MTSTHENISLVRILVISKNNWLIERLCVINKQGHRVCIVGTVVSGTEGLNQQLKQCR